MTMQFNYVRKIDGNGNKTLNLALPYEAYTVATHRRRSGPRQRHRHGRRSDADRLLGAAHLSDVRAEHRAHRAGGRQQPLPRVGRDAEQADVRTTTRSWSRSTPTTATCATTRRATRTRRSTGRGTATSGKQHGGSISSRRVVELRVRLSGIYQLPWGITYSSSFTAQSGDYFFREVQIRDALNTQRRDPHRIRRRTATRGRSCGTTASPSGSRRSAASRSKARSTCSTR